MESPVRWLASNPESVLGLWTQGPNPTIVSLLYDSIVKCLPPSHCAYKSFKTIFPNNIANTYKCWLIYASLVHCRMQPTMTRRQQLLLHQNHTLCQLQHVGRRSNMRNRFEGEYAPQSGSNKMANEDMDHSGRPHKLEDTDVHYVNVKNAKCELPSGRKVPHNEAKRGLPDDDGLLKTQRGTEKRAFLWILGIDLK